MPFWKTTTLSLAGMLLGSTSVLGQGRPNTTSPCDFYTQKTLYFGPFSKYNTVAVPGFVGALVPTTYQGEYCDLNGYFNGALKSANTGKDTGEAVDFFGDGGTEALKQLKPSNGDKSSAQYIFTTHVYSYFGTFLQCSHIGSPELPPYAGKASMYEVHKYMKLNKAEMGWFVDQAVRGLLSIGFSQSDADFVNKTLNGAFNGRCTPATPIIPPSAGPQLQSICIAPDCALAANDTCSAYPDVPAPAVADAKLLGNYSKAADGTTSLNVSTAGNGPGPTKTNVGAAGTGGGFVSLVTGLVAALLFSGLL